MKFRGDLAGWVGAAIVAVVIFLPPLAKYQELRHKSKTIDAKIKSLREETRRLELEKKKLETDLTYIEKEAREKIGVVRKGEIVIKGQGSRQRVG